MKIIFEGKSYDTETAGKICGLCYDRADETEIEQFTETIYRTDDRRYFSYISRFYDSESNTYEVDNHFMEYMRILTADDVVDWIFEKTNGIRDENISIDFFLE